jgi:hypothetical protein
MKRWSQKTARAPEKSPTPQELQRTVHKALTKIIAHRGHAGFFLLKKEQEKERKKTWHKEYIRRLGEGWFGVGRRLSVLLMVVARCCVCWRIWVLTGG